MATGIEVTAKGNLSFEPLKPFMKVERYTSGHTLFRKGEFADKMFVISSGSLFVEDVNITLGPGDLVRRNRCIFIGAEAHIYSAMPVRH